MCVHCSDPAGPPVRALPQRQPGDGRRPGVRVQVQLQRAQQLLPQVDSRRPRAGAIAAAERTLTTIQLFPSQLQVSLYFDF